MATDIAFALGVLGFLLRRAAAVRLDIHERERLTGGLAFGQGLLVHHLLRGRQPSDPRTGAVGPPIFSSRRSNKASLG